MQKKKPLYPSPVLFPRMVPKIFVPLSLASFVSLFYIFSTKNNMHDFFLTQGQDRNLIYVGLPFWSGSLKIGGV